MLISADTRYFIVKSFNHDNVLHAQRDGIWATQEKNAEIFSEAFRTARDVILIFSVNKSGKFQGYARMESAPGTAEMPTWTKGLLWKSSGAFYIRWITICDISFYHLSSLLNRLNEDQPVFVGRDGQEIDPETGAQLCNIVDESRVH
ncbi:YTH domain-containing protein [Kalaharituber pfeilii]|nr:YTH domain-containing protein [Kalaharituber pfeilii]